MCWKVKENGKYKCLDAPVEDTYGFIYLIIGPENKIYVGKKAFLHKKRTKVSARAKKISGTKKRVITSTKSSGWLNYYGSSKELLEDIKLLGKDKFDRFILEYGASKADLSLKEIEWQIKYNVLRTNSYNGWIGGKIFKKHLK